MSATITGSSSNSVNLASPGYVSPTTISGTISAGNAAVFIGSPWTIDVTGTLASQNLFAVSANAFASIQNSGLITAQHLAGIYLQAGGHIDNMRAGRISGASYAIYGGLPAVDISNAGHITASGTAIKTGYGVVQNALSGTIAGGSIGLAFGQGGDIQNAGLITGISIGVKMPHGQVTNTGTILGTTALYMQGGTVTNAGYIASALVSNGTLLPAASGTAISFAAAGLFEENAGGVVLGTVIGDGGTLELGPGRTSLGGLGGSVAGFSADVFAPGASATLSGAMAGFGAISGFAPGDTIHITDMAASGGVLSGGRLDLKIANFYTGAALSFTGTYASGQFSVQVDPNGGTDITVACFLAGTRMRTTGGEVAVEGLRAGDMVPTLHGGIRPVKWIGRRHYQKCFAAGNPDVLPICIRSGALGAGVPARDLLVSPGHALYLGGVLVAARNLVNGTSIIEMGAMDVSYFHIELATHEVIFAEGAPVESYLDTGCRRQFENAGAAEPAALPYPAYRRLEDGFTLATLAARLGRKHQDAVHGPLRGYVETLRPGFTAGWAQCSRQPDVPVCLDVVADGRFAGRILANRHRADLRRAGLGRGFSGFEVAVPGAAGIVLQRSFDGAALSALARVNIA